MERTVICDLVEKENKNIMCTLRCAKTNETVRLDRRQINPILLFKFYGWTPDDLEYALENPKQNKV